MNRPDLLARLDAGLVRGCKLSLISAPVGYGKSTLVSAWVSNLKDRVAWLSLDPEDNEPVRFWMYVIAALQTVYPEIGQTALSLLQTTEAPPVENLLGGIINQLAVISDRVVLVLDDFHLLEALDLQKGFNFFLEHLPPQVHVVLITREDPALPLPRLRARGKMVEIRAKDLQFSMDEAAQFLNHRMQLDLQPGEVEVLERRTEGWVVGLQMAALSLYELDNPGDFIEDFAGDNRYVADYLITEVLERQPTHVRDFLLYTAIVDRFTASLCDVLMAEKHLQSEKIIEQIQSLGLFVIPLDHIRRWYRYHQLFADLLRYRLRQMDPSRFVALNLSASHWFQTQGLINEAVKYALIGEDYEHVAVLIETSGLAMIGRSQLATLQKWISALPEKIIPQHPYLSIFLVWVGALTGQSDLAKKHLALAEENLPAANPDHHSEIVCQIALLKGYAARSGGNLDGSIQYILEAQTHLPEKHVFLDCTIQLNLGGNYWLKGNFDALVEPLRHAVSFVDIAEVEYPALAAAGFLANGYLQQGRLNEAEALCERIVGPKGHVHPAIAYVLLELGELRYERNDLDGALEVLSKAVEIGKSADRIVNLVRACQLLARVHYALGDQDAAMNAMAQADEIFRQAGPRYKVMHQIEYEYYRTCCLLVQDKKESALQWADEYAKRRETIKNPWALLSELAYGHVLLASGRAAQALSGLKMSFDSVKSLGTAGWVVRNLALQSLCYLAVDEEEHALEVLAKALILAEPEGYVRTFVDLGTSMHRLLGLAKGRGVAPGYVAHLLSAFPEEIDQKPQGDHIPMANQTMVEPLTEQELSILRLMAAGLSHNQIAAELYLSLNTVKWHTTHIYSKLGVHRRAHAVSRAKEFGIL